MMNIFGKKAELKKSKKVNAVKIEKKISNASGLDDQTISNLANEIYNCKFNSVGCSPHVNRLITDVNRKISPGYLVKTDGLKS